MKVLANVELCVSCGKCERICPNNGIYVIDGIPIKCMHCEKSPCLNVCPEEAIERINGKVVLNKDKCVGCGLCMTVCPIGAIRFSLDVASKCNGCYDREEELCKLVCPTNALDELEHTIDNKQQNVISKFKKIYSYI
ncbi:4Fe-4S dicluster domain-containing protein [Methanotorris igneus]|uniref:4Fe-4S ferredoxin iron-sulfur binding domain-containing protein n=1 Tax=Methanotorris igneus (strain DSM 5666 / JCM 11834 / Kol 5) TaxID=880724 RepID=F6BF23_METIK|nr:4Fe-4S binding protein [Methanotorris igneus]AEF96893.1 4Fe-4S ferredoxin iron-sulfur binding domain-containing protein [Methanotorris igneus Kol 5]